MESRAPDNGDNSDKDGTNETTLLEPVPDLPPALQGGKQFVTLVSSLRAGVVTSTDMFWQTHDQVLLDWASTHQNLFLDELLQLHGWRKADNK